MEDNQIIESSDDNSVKGYAVDFSNGSGHAAYGLYYNFVDVSPTNNETINQFTRGYLGDPEHIQIREKAIGLLENLNESGNSVLRWVIASDLQNELKNKQNPEGEDLVIEKQDFDEMVKSILNDVYEGINTGLTSQSFETKELAEKRTNCATLLGIVIGDAINADSNSNSGSLGNFERDFMGEGKEKTPHPGLVELTKRIKSYLESIDLSSEEDNIQTFIGPFETAILLGLKDLKR